MTPCARVAVDWHVVGATGGHAKKKGHNRKQERAARLAAARHPAQLVQRAHGGAAARRGRGACAALQPGPGRHAVDVLLGADGSPVPERGGARSAAGCGRAGRQGARASAAPLPEEGGRVLHERAVPDTRPRRHRRDDVEGVPEGQGDLARVRQLTRARRHVSRGAVCATHAAQRRQQDAAGHARDDVD